MAYPAPTIQNINAFDATVGAIIDFSIVSGTESSQIMRSNRIYIYELDTNDLLCSHLYVSTDTIHELPARNDASMVYASGKSYTDFVNGKQYYAQIQMYTDTTGTTIGSALSLSKIFWCLPTPSLNISTITTPYALTSCTVTATYNTNITSVISTTNELAQYQFDLYDGSGTLVNSSGIITDSGTQVGTSTSYTLSYNFLGLSNGTSYQVRLSAVSVEGMTKNATSNTFTVDISAPTLDAATAINNACGGYISVISQLSGSYVSTITRVLIKRQDVDDITNTWVTLYSKNVTQASDLNFTFIDFMNQHGRSYVYAVVPVITQTQDGYQVEVEGGYTSSGLVYSHFNGVFLADNTGIQKFVAGVGYNDSSVVQAVGVHQPIGSKYPVVVSNGNINYQTGSLTAYALDDSLWSLDNGLSLKYLVTNDNDYIVTDNSSYLAVAIKDTERFNRQSIMALRKIIEQFLANKKPKILKDWNGNMWLVMITDNISISWANDWGMGISKFDAPWTEIGDPTSQDDLEDCGMIKIA